MGDIRTDKIVSISEVVNNATIPVYWGIPADNVHYNNAIAMGIVMARRIDKANIWDGLLHIREVFNKIKVRPRRVNLVDFTASYTNSVSNVLTPDPAVIVERRGRWVADPWYPKHKKFIDTFISRASNAVVDGLKIILTFSNPIQSFNATALTHAINVITIVGSTTTTLTITDVQQLETEPNKLELIFADGTTFDGTVSIAYTSSISPIHDYDGNTVPDFVMAFEVADIIAISEESEELNEES